MHECTIGMIFRYDEYDLITLPELDEYISEQKEQAERFSRIPGIARKVYSLNDYADRRKSTNLTRFEYCPYCGKKIDWKGIRKNGHN